MNGFYLIDHTHGAAQMLQDRLYTTASLIALKYGGTCNNYSSYQEDHIREFWKYDAPYPSFGFFQRNVSVPTIKWFIRNKIKISEDQIWNADFLCGITKHGKIRWHKKRYPTFYWSRNAVVLRLIEECPFGGRISSRFLTHKWINVPALYLKPSENSLSFMAGVFAGGQLHEEEGQMYAKYSILAKPYFEKWSVPIERYILDKKHFLVSPIWPALFSLWMPTGVGKSWLQIKNAAVTEIYAPVLWKTYVNTTFPSKGIPYLKSRRAIYRDFKEEIGVARKLETLRVEKNLTELDNRVKKAIWEWKGGGQCRN